MNVSVFRRSPRATLIGVCVAIVILVPALGLTAASAYAGEVPRGTSVLGVDIGGGSRDEAAVKLAAGLAEQEQLGDPVPVVVGDVETEIWPHEVRLEVDVEATVAAAASEGWGPIPQLFGARQVDPVVAVDLELLDEVLQDIAGDAEESPVLPEITFDGTEPVVTYPAPGFGLDADLAAAALTDAWPPRRPDGDGWAGPEVVRVPRVEVQPAMTVEEVDRLVDDFVRPAVSGPVVATTPEDGQLTISPRAIARSLRLKPDDDGVITPSVDAKKLRKALEDELAEVETEPRDARVQLASGGPEVVSGVKGKRVDVKALAEELFGVLPADSGREVPAVVVEEDPEFTDADAEALGISEKVSTFTTHFDGGLSSPRSQNIVRAAELVDGAMVLPGEVFSLNGHTGERTAAMGFKEAPVIIDGRLQPGIGGGVSQFTTTLFNAAYYAGLEDVEHSPHTIHYSRYPAVIEATIFYPHLDLKFRNNTDHGILIDTSYTDGSITVTLWGTKVWDEVTTEWSAKRNITKPDTRHVPPGPSCIATGGIDGFTQDAWRIFRRGGSEVKREQFTWRYDPQPQVICAEEPDD